MVRRTVPGGLGCTHKYKKFTLEEILALRHVWITLRHQWGNCLKPIGLSFDPLVK